MRKNIKKQLLAVSAASLICAIAPASAFAATTINATILADNGSIAVHQQGSTYSVIPSSVAGNWPNAKTFSFDVPDDARSLAQCRIHVISWGDGSVAQGVMAHFASTGGVAFTGQAGSSLNNVAMSSIMHGGSTAAGQAFANNNANAQSIITGAGAASTGFTSAAVIAGGIPGLWGPINLPATMEGRADVKFVWNEKSDMLNSNPRNYRVISTPCRGIVKPEEPMAHVNSWEIAGQFQLASNPYEVWTYGYKVNANCTGPLVPFTNKATDTYLGRSHATWRRGTSANPGDLPNVSQNLGNTLLTPLKLSPRGLSLHPGPQNQCAVVRFTVPEDGKYRMMGRFWAQNISAVGNETDTDTMVIPSSGGPISAAVRVQGISGPVHNNHFEVVGAGRTFAKGDTIDFMVGSRGNYNSDSTGLHGFIERVTP